MYLGRRHNDCDLAAGVLHVLPPVQLCHILDSKTGEPGAKLKRDIPSKVMAKARVQLFHRCCVQMVIVVVADEHKVNLWEVWI